MYIIIYLSYSCFSIRYSRVCPYKDRSLACVRCFASSSPVQCNIAYQNISPEIENRDMLRPILQRFFFSGNHQMVKSCQSQTGVAVYSCSFHYTTRCGVVVKESPRGGDGSLSPLRDIAMIFRGRSQRYNMLYIKS